MFRALNTDEPRDQVVIPRIQELEDVHEASKHDVAKHNHDNQPDLVALSDWGHY